jgi:RND family efflux transporter MFP subunit
MTTRHLCRNAASSAAAAALLCALSAAAHAHPANILAKGASCLIDANSVVKLSSATQGTLATVEVRRGDQVKAGQIVARLESSVEQTIYEAARLKAESDAIIHAREADKLNADKKLDRIRHLQTNDYASLASLQDAEKDAAVAKFALEQAVLDKQLASAEVDRLHAVIERRLIRSPVDGVVTKVDLHAGEYAESNNPVATIAEIRPLLIEVYLPVEAYPLVLVGMRAQVRPQEPIGGLYIAEVVTKDPQIDSASGTFQLTLKLPNQDGTVPAGLRCTIQFLD